MAYTSKDAVKTFLEYLEITEEQIEYISDTKSRGIIFEDKVIFISPVSYSEYNDKGFFDTRDSGAKERFITWLYARERKLKYFCVAVHNIVERYKDYIFSLECSEKQIQNCSGKVTFNEKERTGTQIVIPRTFKPKKDFERIRTEYGFYISASKRKHFLNYMEIFDNRPYEIDIKNEYMEEKIENIPHPHNRIIFGAPGTGKSHKLEEQQQKCFGDNYERVTFHPNYSYAQFVGTYKPVMKTNNNPLGDYEKKVIKILSDEKITPSEKYKMLYQSGLNVSALCGLIGLTTGVTDFTTIKADGTISEKDHTLMSGVGKNMNPYATLKTLDKESEITYSYIPGPFMRVYVNAKKNPKKNFLLLIEEINRANVAAVFGDVFQLLDRKSDGTSQYPIAASEDQKNYLESCGINDDEISIPSNMYIWATMNSADQGVQPMDAAFKRRWDFEYIGIDDNEESVKDYVLPIPQKNSDGNIFYTSENWNKIRKDINNKLKNIYGVNEDKLLGPYFLSKSTLDEAKQINFESETDKAEKICSLFKSKVLMYLYEDVVKMNPTELFSKSEFESDKPIHYSDLCNKFDEVGLKIFGEEFVKDNG